MAIQIEFVCAQCRSPKTKMVGLRLARHDEVCNECLTLNADAKRKAFLDELKKLPLEERLARVEAFIYDHEQVQHGFIPPRRF